MGHGRQERYRIPPPEEVTDHTPLRLEIAARLAFPDGSMGVPGLRSEIRARRLPAEKIAGRIYVTLAGIKEMREACRLESGKPRSKEPTGSDADNTGPSSTTTTMVNGESIELASLRASLSKSSTPTSTKTSRRKTTSQPSAPVIPLKSKS